MKKLASLLLAFCLCLGLMVPVLADYPSTAEEANKAYGMRTSFSDDYDNFVEDPFELYNMVMNMDGTISPGELNSSFKGYYVVSSDTVFTLVNRCVSDDYYVYLIREAFVKNEDGVYVLSYDDSRGSSLRYNGFKTDMMYEGEPGEPQYRVYLGEGETYDYVESNGNTVSKALCGKSVSFNASTLCKGIAEPGDDVIYKLTIWSAYPLQGYWRASLYYKVDDEAAAKIMAQGKDEDIEPITVENPFADVSADSYYYDPVRWALQKGITTGMSENSFGPELTCTRGQVVTFLWRANGCPEPASTENPFTDVKQSDYFYKPVLWALEQGITTGTTATTFAPGATCTSAHVLTFLWRASGEPFAVGNSELADTYSGQWYSDALLWADVTGLLDGPDTPFAPSNNSPRADIVTYLYRSMG